MVKHNVNANVFKIGKWTFNIEPTTDHIKKCMTIDDLMNGHFVYTEPVYDMCNLHMSYNLDDKNRTKRLFKGLRQFNSYVPKCTSGIYSFEPTGYVKITMTYE
jgi:hypothetical protein